MRKQIANIITICRMAGSILLLFFPVFSAEYFLIYILCGFSDMIDGIIARKTDSASSLGAKIDTAADMAFAAAALTTMLPKIPVPGWVWIWGAVTLVIKIFTLIGGWLSQKQFVSLHTAMNRITGCTMFLLPLTFSFIDMRFSFVIVCSLATLAALQEGFYILTKSKKGKSSVRKSIDR